MKTITFNGNGDDFSAISEAQKWLDDNGYSYGSMCGDYPIAIARGVGIQIAKWRNISKYEKDNEIDGVIKSLDFRCGSVTIEFKDESLADQGLSYSSMIGE